MIGNVKCIKKSCLRHVFLSYHFQLPFKTWMITDLVQHTWLKWNYCRKGTSNESDEACVQKPWIIVTHSQYPDPPRLQLSCDHDEHMHRRHKIKSQNFLVRLKNVHDTILWLTQSGISKKRSACKATWQGSLMRSSNLLMLKGSRSNKIIPACQSEASRKVVWQMYSLCSHICRAVSGKWG